MFKAVITSTLTNVNYGEGAFYSSLELANAEIERLKLKTHIFSEGNYIVDVSEVLPTQNSPEAKKLRSKIASEKSENSRRYKKFGANVEDYFIGMINERGYTSEQKDSLEANPDVIAIMARLAKGRIVTAKTLVDALIADEDLFFEADLDAVSMYMADFLENEEA